MIQILSVHFDQFIPNWRTQMEVITHNVLVLVLEGKVRYTINGKVIIAERGDLLYIPAFTNRCGENVPNSPHQKITVLFKQETAMPTGIPFMDDKQFFRYRLANSQYVQRRFERLFEESRNGQSFRTMICLGIFHELLGLLSRELEKPEVTPAKMKYAQIVQQHLLDHYREPIEVEQLAKLIHRSPNYTTALFREVFGDSPIRYMHQLRIHEACNLLLDSDMSVADIAQYLGYYDTSYFFRMFKKYCMMSPTEFIVRGRPSDVLQLFS